MPDDGAARIVQTGPETAAGPSGRIQVLAFVTDAESEAVLRLGLLAAAFGGLVVHRGDSCTAVAAMGRMPTPRVLIVDVSGDEQPMSALTALSEVVEPDVKVLVIGDREDMNLYRQLTRTLGVAEYLYKPLSAEVVAQHFGPHVNPAAAVAAHTQGGRVIAVTAVCGGAGATTIAANLAWHLAAQAKRHTVLLDGNLHTGNAAMLLGAKTGGGLRTAIETPQRLDDLFMERIAQPAGDRLSVIAGEEKLTDRLVIAEGGAQRLLQGLRRRYNYVVLDVPLAPTAWHGELLEQARQRVLVMEPTLAAVRDALRVLALQTGAQQTRQSLVLLNKLGIPGTMTRSQVEAALQHEIEVVVPYLPRVINPAATMGTPAAMPRSGFSSAIRHLAREVASTSVAKPAAGIFGRWFNRWTPP